MRRAVVLALVLAACRRERPPDPPPPPPAPAAALLAAAGATDASPSVPRELRKIASDHEESLPPCPSGEGDLLAAAATFYDSRRYEDALACAAQAAARSLRSAAAHSERGAALSALGRLEEARVAYARALALESDNADALLGAADLYLTRLPPSRDYNELGFEYARRGHHDAKKARNRELIGQFALLEAMALNGLGRNREALERAEEAIANGADDEGEARYERASALYELCRFREAEQVFERLVVDAPERRAYAHHHLGLIHERDGRDDLARRAFAAARTLSPADFPAEIEIALEEFRSLVDGAVRGLPTGLARDLYGVPVETQDLPVLADLTASDPPLSPAILGLFRGPSLGDPCPLADEEPGPCRSIVLYRRNLVRIVGSRDELERQVRQTLVHEIGHLRGEDDVQLAARGLE